MPDCTVGVAIAVSSREREQPGSHRHAAAETVQRPGWSRASGTALRQRVVDLPADGDAGVAEGSLDVADAQLAEVEHGRGEHRVGAGLDRGREVGGLPRAAAGDDRHGDLASHRADQLEVEAGLGAVGVHRVEQHLTDAELGCPHDPLDGVPAGAAPPAVRGDLEAGVGDRAVAGAAGVEGEHEHLVAEAVADLADQLRPRDGGGVDGDLVRAGAQQPVDVGHRAHPAADGERDEHALRGPADDIVGGLAVAGAGGDVEEGELVGALGVVDPGHLHRVAGVAQVDEVDALDDPAGVDVQARDDAHRERHATPSRTASASISTSIAGSSRPLTSTMAVAGRILPKASPCTRPTSSHRLMSVTYIRVRTTSARVKPARSRAVAIAAMAWRVCAATSPGCATVPSTTDVQPLTQALSPRTTTRL